MEQNAQIKDMEAEIEWLVREKEKETPMEVIPLSEVPLTRFSTISVSTTTIAKIPSTIPLTILEKSVKLEKLMEKMTLQGTKINRLKKEVENLQEIKSSYQKSYNIENKTS